MVLKVWNWVGNSLVKLMISFSVKLRNSTSDINYQRSLSCSLERDSRERFTNMQRI